MFERFEQYIFHSHKRFLLRRFLLRLSWRVGGLPLLLALARLFYRLEVEGEVHIPQQGGCLVIFNHVSSIADILLFLIVRRRRPDACLFVHNLSGTIVASMLQAMGLQHAQEHILWTYDLQTLSAAGLLNARQVLLDGGCVVMAPEGELTWDGRLQHPLAPGAAWLALRSGAPVVPIVSLGGYDVSPLWQMEKIRLTGRIRIRAGRPLVLGAQPQGRLTDAQVQEANQRLWQALAALLEDQRF